MMAGGWLVGAAAIFFVGPVENVAIALMGISLIAGGMIGMVLKAERMYRMVIGASAGAFTAWLGFRFAFTERLLPVVSEPRDLADQDLLVAIALGLAVMFIGIGGVLEAVRAQRDPGTSPLAVRVFLILVGLFITAAIASAAGVSPAVTALLAVSVAVGLTAMAFLRRERPLSDFLPQA